MLRCNWVTDDLIYQNYHDNEWGVPVHDDFIHFEFIVLESFQAGLNWLTILKKREDFRKSFDQFDFRIIANYGDEKIDELMENKKIIRNYRKIKAAINNAQQFIRIREEYGTFDNYIWSFVDGIPVKSHFGPDEHVPCHTELSEIIAKDFKKRGFTFMGKTIVYSYLQAVGIVIDHTTNCICYKP